MGIFGIQDGHTAAEISFQTRSLKKYFSLTFKIWYVGIYTGNVMNAFVTLIFKFKVTGGLLNVRF